MSKKEKVFDLKNKGLSFTEIGKLCGITRQRAHQIYSGYKSSSVPTLQIPSSWSPSDVPNLKRKNLSSFEGRDFLKEIVRIRDNHTCQLCGMVWKKGKRRLDVHHLDEHFEGTNGLPYSACKDFDRQITLCHKCHMNLDQVRKKMKDSWRKKQLGIK